VRGGLDRSERRRRWVDRLGRNYDDGVETIQKFMKRGVIIKTVVDGFTFDGSTTDPIQKAVRDGLISFMATTAQPQAEANEGCTARGHRTRQGQRADRVPWPHAGEVRRDQFGQRHAEHRWVLPQIAV
jgi:hypothetical protein